MKKEFTELYDFIFDPIFLVRYGYYDISIPNKKMNTEKVEIDNDYGKSDSTCRKCLEHLSSINGTGRKKRGR